MAAGIDPYYERLAIALSEILQQPDYGSTETEEEEPPKGGKEG